MFVLANGWSGLEKVVCGQLEKLPFSGDAFEVMDAPGLESKVRPDHDISHRLGYIDSICLGRGRDARPHMHCDPGESPTTHEHLAGVDADPLPQPDLGAGCSHAEGTFHSQPA
jgi:hypothetical protein